MVKKKKDQCNKHLVNYIFTCWACNLEKKYKISLGHGAEDFRRELSHLKEIKWVNQRM